MLYKNTYYTYFTLVVWLRCQISGKKSWLFHFSTSKNSSPKALERKLFTNSSFSIIWGSNSVWMMRDRDVIKPRWDSDSLTLPEECGPDARVQQQQVNEGPSVRRPQQAWSQQLHKVRTGMFQPAWRRRRAGEKQPGFQYRPFCTAAILTCVKR